MKDTRAALISRLEEKFRWLTTALYDTSVPPAEVDAAMRPYIDDGIRFVDPWQTEAGVERYRLGLAGFHTMFRFHFELIQLSVTLDADGTTGRCICDGVMHLKQFAPLLTYPLRTILTYEFVVDDAGDAKRPVRFRIHRHEEMWSFGDMLAAVPVTGWLYSKLFRPAFARGFLAASWLSARMKGALPG
jgi:hypothetical protein